MTVTVTVMVVKLLAVLGTIGLWHASQESSAQTSLRQESCFGSKWIRSDDQKLEKLKIIKCIFLVLRLKQLFKIVFYIIFLVLFGYN